MKKSELLRALQAEIALHYLDTFMHENEHVVQSGCPQCKKMFGTVPQLIRHLTDDALPPLIDKLSTEKSE